MASESHGHALGDAGANQIPRRRSAAVVEQPSWDSSPFARTSERDTPDPDGNAVAIEDRQTALLALRSPPTKHREQRPRQREQAAEAGL
jgi:hypothetical protein